MKAILIIENGIIPPTINVRHYNPNRRFFKPRVDHSSTENPL